MQIIIVGCGKVGRTLAEQLQEEESDITLIDVSSNVITSLQDDIDAMGIVLYGMFLAIIIPPARDNKVIRGLVIIAMAASFLFTKIPVIKNISSGMKVIILTVVISGVAAVLFPLPDEEKEEEEANHEA